MSDYRLQPLTGFLGASVEGLDLRRLSDDEVASLRRHFQEHLVLFFPAQHLSPDELSAFGRRFHALQAPHAGLQSHPDNPAVFVIETDGGEGDGKDNESWHSDITFAAEPPIGSVLQAVQLPALGGDTLFASMYAAYDALSDPIKRAVEGLQAWHDGIPYFQQYVRHMGFADAEQRIARMREDYPGAAHPLVRRHPETGRRSLYIGRVFTQQILGLSRIESHHLKNLLCDHVEHSSFQVRWRWSPGDIAMWDNRCTLHFAAGDYGLARRVMHRVTWVGEKPMA